VADFEYCLRCGQPLRSWFSRHVGFGLQCWEALDRRDRRKLLDAARALQADLDTLVQVDGRFRLRQRIRLLVAGLRDRS
jgi:hypothetical protein